MTRNAAYFVSLSLLVSTGLIQGQASAPAPTKQATQPIPPKPTPAPATVPLEEYKKLEARVKVLESSSKFFYGLAKRVTALEHPTVDLDPSSPGGYSQIDTSIGPLLVSLESAEPYLDGIRAMIKIGNPYTADFTSYDINAEWSIRLGEDNFDEWLKKMKKKEFSFTGSLPSGRWTHVTLVFPDTVPKDFGYLNVSLHTNTIGLNK